MRWRVVSKSALLCCFSICVFSVLCALFTKGWRSSSTGTTQCLGIRCSIIHIHNTKEWVRVRRRSLAGLGSFPPSCIGKCSTCTPCRAVHVAVLPGMPVTMEYYPEAWRCKCGNRLYIPQHINP